MTEIETKQDYDELLQLVSFNLDEEEFGVDILKVREINKMLQITRVPNSPHYVEGVINLRGRIIPVVDLRAKVGLKKKSYNNNTRIIVVEIADKTIGFIVDKVSEVLRIPKNVTEAPPELIAGIDSDYITAVGKLEDRLLILLDLNKVFNTEQIELLGAMN
ncbi:MAG TPA: purine-binding chemotaxis protein CheW [Ignavibacteria bacterium]|nr:purine-binding chemotaxis protein CheW [Ignavibacteria bacterium]